MARLYKTILKFYFLASVCLWIEFVSSDDHEEDFSEIDIFKAIDINGHTLYGSRPVKVINDYLVDSTKSADPDTNLDLLMDKLILYYKKAVKDDNEFVKVKRLILSLRGSNYNDEYRCSRFYNKILSKCLLAFGTDLTLIDSENTDEMSRLDKIVFHYIKERVKNCAQIYIKRYDEIRANLNQTQLLNLLDPLSGPAIKGLTTPERDHGNGLEKVAVSKNGRLFKMSPKYTYNRMKYLAKGDPSVAELDPIRDRKTGILHINRPAFYKIFSEYIARPCVYFRDTFGKEVFEPLLFDIMFKHQIQEGRSDFYEALMKYRLCRMDPIRKELVRVISFVEKQADDVNVEEY